MPRQARTLAQRWADIIDVLMIPEGIYELVDTYVVCRFCTVRLNYVTEINIRKHHKSQLHQANTDLQAGRADPSEDAQESCQSRCHAFYYDLAEALMAADIPFEKLNNAKFVSFLQKNMKRRIPDASTLRKTYTDIVYQKKMQAVRTEIGDNPIYLSVDETNDSLGRFITHAIVAPLLPDSPGIPRIIHCAEISVGNADKITEFVEQSLAILWPGGIQREKVLLFVTDAAPYMMAAGEKLKIDHNYAKLVHVSCLAHGLHRVAEEVRGTYRVANNVISETKLVFSKAPRRKRLFREMAPNVPLPPQPVITRWGEWLKASSYYCNHFLSVQQVIEALDGADAAVVESAQQLWRTPNLQTEFQLIHQNYHCITLAITQLEERGMTLQDSIRIVTGVAAFMNENLAIPLNIRQRMESVLMNNTGFSTDLINIFQVLQGVPNVNLPNGWNMADVQRMTHAPTTSCEVERSFSSFKTIFRSNRQSLTTENLEKFVVVNFNQLEFVDVPPE